MSPRRLRMAAGLLLPALLAGCPSDDEEADPPRQVEEPVSWRHQVCLRVLETDSVRDRHEGPDHEQVTLRHGEHEIGVYTGTAPAYPGFVDVVAGLPDEATPNFVAVDQTSVDGTRFILHGRQREAGEPMLFVMLSGSEAAFAGDGYISEWDVIDCPPPRADVAPP